MTSCISLNLHNFHHKPYFLAIFNIWQSCECLFFKLSTHLSFCWFVWDIFLRMRIIWTVANTMSAIYRIKILMTMKMIITWLRRMVCLDLITPSAFQLMVVRPYLCFLWSPLMNFWYLQMRIYIEGSGRWWNCSTTWLHVVNFSHSNVSSNLDSVIEYLVFCS